ncbi:putative repeat protein (TIGR04061 family) [Chitinivorax tropicus]|uniref:Putative repeat protein (TIGR04061 family) n=1 Tax=Chitinivorax tropicus TaxID=714531 RepID=A0A840MPC8_9PROT|nr:methanobactin biosynthesis protein MbnC [Chitinivorax tropicus]MBB5018602.1 putative repeat protein (TIGR04061 family) [Chitinivorax tropicus]
MRFPSLTALPDRMIRDRELLDQLIDPTARQRLPRDSRAFVRVDMSLRNYWHTLFDVCPDLLDMADPAGEQIFDGFMAWAAEQHLSMGWHFYLWVGRWLAQSPFQHQLTDALQEQLMAAAAARWAVLDRSPQVGVVLGRAASTGWVVGWKPNSLLAGRRVERIEVDSGLPSPEADLGLFYTNSFELDTFPGWQVLPK